MNLKKFSLLGIVAALFVAFTVYAPSTKASTMPFTDVTNADPEFYKAVQELYADGVVFGITNTAFKPNQQATRGETAQMIVNALGWENEAFTNPNFSDVSTSHKYYKAIAILANKQVIKGSDGKFRPDGTLSRANIAQIITLSFELQPATSTKTPFKDIAKLDASTQLHIATLVEQNVTKGATSTTFNPNGKMTRKHLALFIHRALKLNTTDGDEFELIGIE